ncbi:MAG: cytochrome c3 family protein [Proteobacteria bacterium]|nr:cytochrome c3 family protein [Pseudomonadota bacterium]
MKRKMIVSILLAASVVLGAGPGLSAGQEGKVVPEGHADLTDQQMLIACSDCHQTETPDIYNQWYESLHGIGMVKCYQCHGTFENLVVVPEKSVCGACHSAAMAKCPTDKPCGDCHQPHTFKVKK